MICPCRKNLTDALRETNLLLNLAKGLLRQIVGLIPIVLDNTVHIIFVLQKVCLSFLNGSQTVSNGLTDSQLEITVASAVKLPLYLCNSLTCKAGVKVNKVCNSRASLVVFYKRFAVGNCLFEFLDYS